MMINIDNDFEKKGLVFIELISWMVDTTIVYIHVSYSSNIFIKNCN